jgi:LysM repeat protein
MKRKFRIPKLFKFRRKKLRATAVRRPLRFAATAASYEEMSEPNMKLSRALLIVLLLHVVAVAGIIAFNAIKTRQGAIVSSPAPATPSSSSIAPAANAKSANPIQSSLVQKGSGKTTGKDGAKADHKQESGKAPAESGKVYVVAKGDNPVTIAKKFKVSYDDLLAINHIDDPRKLQIGQKLLIPTKTEKPKKAE